MPSQNGGKKTTKSSSIPSVSMDTDDSIADMVNENIPSINLSTEPENDNSDKSERIAMTTKSSNSKKASQKGTRKVADISEMAKPHDPNDIPGVDVKKSPEDEILKPGGPFDKYVANKKAEYYERMKYEDEKAAIEAYEAGEDPSMQISGIEETPMDDEEAEIIANTGTASNVGNIKVNSVSATPSFNGSVTPVDDLYEYDVTTGSNIQYQQPPQSSTDDYLDYNKTSNPDEPVPFYTGIGYEDDYNYPDEYDIPSDDELFPDLDDGESEEEETIQDEGLVEDNEYEIEDDYFVEENEELEDMVMDDNEDIVEEEETEATEDEELKETIEEDKEAEEEIKEEEEEKTSFREHEKIGSKRVAFTTDESSLDDLEKEVENDTGLPTEDERLEELKAEITAKVTPKARALDLSGFTVATKTTASNKILNMKETSAGKWVLPTTGITYQIREISGQKIEYLRDQASTNTPTAAKNVLQVIYDHIITPKPATLEQWAKSIAYADYDHLYMGIYLAAFSGANYMPMTCVMESGKIAKKETGCGKMFLTDNLDIMKMVKFKDDDSKRKFWDLYNSDRTNSEGLYVSEIIPVSDKFAIAFCEPTLYSVMIENNNLGNSRDFADKYQNIIAFMPYISEIYWIDAPRNTLVPISYQTWDNNASKNYKSKVIRYSNIFDSLSTDEYSAIVSIINGINEADDWFTYVIPEMTCPECGRTIPEEDITASGLVFTRHRLGILATTSTK